MSPNSESEQATRVEGYVIDDRNRPLVGATIAVTRRNVVATLLTATADSRGHFAFFGLPVAEELVLQAAAMGYQARRVELAPLRSGERAEHSVVLRPGSSIRGWVRDDQRKAVAAATVGCSEADALLTATDADGHFELQGLSGAPLNLFVHARGFATRIVRDASPGSEDIDVTLERSATVTGKTSVPATVDHVLVSACRFDNDFHKEICVARQIVRAPTDRYELKDLAPGAYELVVEAEGYPARRSSIAVSPGQNLPGPALLVLGRGG